MATLINGDGNPAVYAIQDADFYTALLGGQTRILNRGLKFAYHIENINTFLIDDGLILTKEGRRIQLDSPAQDEITIPNGVQGSTQYYIVGYHLYTDSDANQVCETFIRQMDSATATIEEKTFYEGETEVYISLYRIAQNELTVSNVTLLLPYDTNQAQDRAAVAANAAQILNNMENTSDVESGNVATRAYVEEQFVQYVVGGHTYLAQVTAAISIGDTIENGVNVRNTTLASEINKDFERTKVDTPTVSGAYTYDGTEKTVSISSYNPNIIVIGGTLSATNAGTYYVEASLVDSFNYCWQDGTNGIKKLAWTIQKAANRLQLDTASITGLVFNATGTLNANVTRKSDGTISGAVAPDTAGTVNISGDAITFTPANYATQISAVIAITDSGDGNYAESSATITLTNAIFAKKVTWENGTDAEISTVVSLLDDRLITTSETGWTIGDERSTSLAAMAATGVGESHAAQGATLVLMATGIFSLTSATSGGKTTASYVVGLKNVLAEPGHMNAVSTNPVSWGASKRRIWCNNVFKNAIPSSIRGIFKQFVVKTAASYNSGAVETTNDYFALPAEKEVDGAGSYANPVENSAVTQFTYYATTANRAKHKGDTTTQSTYWTRSPEKEANYSTMFINFYASGDAGFNASTAEEGISPFGVI